MSGEELLASIQEYQLQLDQVQAALETADADEKLQLQELQVNLLQVIELTLQQLQQQQKLPENSRAESTAKQKPAEEANCESIAENDMDKEFALFQAEIAALDGQEYHSDDDVESSSSTTSDDDDSTQDKNAYSYEDLKALEGKQVQAPFTEAWGGYSYHNAIVMSVDEPDMVNFANPQVRVLYRQPTSLAMLPCRFFLSGRCRFSEDACRYSHGALVSVTDLREYEEPDMDAILTGTRVLTQHESKDELWHPGTVQDVLEDRSAFSVLCDICKTVAEAFLDSMVPLPEAAQKEQDFRKSGRDENLDQEGDGDDEIEATVFPPVPLFPNNSSSQCMGEWEKYTKGIGSKLMAKMGYIVGTGLGPHGDGKVDPVTAYVYPQGVSLDRCMELRENCNGEEFLEVEKRLKRQKAKEEKILQRQAEKLAANTSVFDIINTKLSGKGKKHGTGSESVKEQMNISKQRLQSDSDGELNRKTVRLGSSIKQVEREVTRLTESKQRHVNDIKTAEAIDERLQGKLKELKSLQLAEEKVSVEQQQRREYKKYCVF